MQIFIAFIAVAIIIEYAVAVLTDKLPAAVVKYLTANILSLLLGVLIAFAFRLDLFTVIGQTTAWLWLAYLITGILLAGGSKLWHELISKLRESREGVYTGGPETYYTLTNIPPAAASSTSEFEQ